MNLQDMVLGLGVVVVAMLVAGSAVFAVSREFSPGWPRRRPEPAPAGQRHWFIAALVGVQCLMLLLLPGSLWYPFSWLSGYHSPWGSGLMSMCAFVLLLVPAMVSIIAFTAAFPMSLRKFANVARLGIAAEFSYLLAAIWLTFS